MMKSKLYTILIGAIAFVSMAIGCLAQDAPKEPLRLSFETLGVIRYSDIGSGHQDYGVGLDAGYEFNRYVIGHVRAISYQNDDWGGSVVDEGSLLVEARLFSSQNSRVSLSAIGGADRDFDRDKWGLSVGLRPSLWIWKGLSLVTEARIRAWMGQQEDLSVVGALQYKF